MKREITTINALVYYISNNSKSWDISSPYYMALKDILLNEPTNLGELRIQQDFHFIAKIINDELSNNILGINSNISKLKEFLESYKKDKNEKIAEKILNIIFHINLLNLLNNDKHYKKLNMQEIKDFINKYNFEKNHSILIKKILCLLYGVKNESVYETSENEKNLALEVLYFSLVIKNEASRTKENLTNYYLKQNQLEKISLEQLSSERAKGELLEIGVILKAANGKGLYLPENEKEQYLSNFAKDILRNKYLSLFKQINSTRLFNFLIPNWLLALLFFGIQSIIFLIPNFIDSLSLGFISLNISFFKMAPVWLIIIINGIIISLYLFFLRKAMFNRADKEKWK